MHFPQAIDNVSAILVYWYLTESRFLHIHQLANSGYYHHYHHCYHIYNMLSDNSWFGMVVRKVSSLLIFLFIPVSSHNLLAVLIVTCLSVRTTGF